jgi:hypothetical protein
MHVRVVDRVVRAHQPTCDAFIRTASCDGDGSAGDPIASHALRGSHDPPPMVYLRRSIRMVGRMTMRAGRRKIRRLEDEEIGDKGHAYFF